MKTELCPYSRPAEGLAVDAAHSAKNGLTQFRCVDLKTGEELFRKSIGDQTVNIGEFLGVVEAVKYVLEHNFQPSDIYTDSTTAITWYENKATASMKRLPSLHKAEVFLKVCDDLIKDIRVMHWDNAGWGETPADFGYK